MFSGLFHVQILSSNVFFFFFQISLVNCFSQFPAVYSKGMVLVISPLIALMQAQVFDLNRSNIRACLVGSAQQDPFILTRIDNGEFNIIYSSPEFLQLVNGKKLLNILQNRLLLVAIDVK